MPPRTLGMKLGCTNSPRDTQTEASDHGSTQKSNLDEELRLLLVKRWDGDLRDDAI